MKALLKVRGIDQLPETLETSVGYAAEGDFCIQFLARKYQELVGDDEDERDDLHVTAIASDGKKTAHGMTYDERLRFYTRIEESVLRLVHMAPKLLNLARQAVGVLNEGALKDELANVIAFVETDSEEV
jgi:hypothetical protein